MLSAHYRSPISFSDESLGQAESAAARIKNSYLELISAPVEERPSSHGEETLLLDEAHERFDAALDDDFNTAGAIGTLFEAIRTINHATSGGKSLSPAFRERALSFFDYVNGILGIVETTEGGDKNLEEEVEALLAEREKARRDRDFKRADSIRDELASRGITLEDTTHGTRWRQS
jgi:cysteinyl-tRNA synthetase